MKVLRLLALFAASLAVHAAWAMVASASGGGAVPRGPKPEFVNLHEVSVQLAVAAVSLVLLGFFSLSETAITTLWPWKVRELAAREEDVKGPFSTLQQDITRFLTTILIGSTVSGIAATAFITDAAFKVLGEAGVGWTTVALTFVTLIFCEIMPKSVAVVHATPIARMVIPAISFLAVILYPIGKVSKVFTQVFLKLFGIEASEEPFVSEEELKLVLSGAMASGSVMVEENDMISSVLELEDMPVREIMTPLVDVVAVATSDTLLDMRNLWKEHQFSRVPVYEERVDNIVGVMYCYDLLNKENLDEMKVVPVQDMCQTPPYFIPETMSVWNLLREFRIRKSHMAVVVNEYGGTVGIATLEDVVEEIVGEIYDETDREDADRANIVNRGDGVFDIDAKTDMDQLSEVMELEFPDGDYETAGGYTSSVFGCIPEVWSTKNVGVPKLVSQYETCDYGEQDEEGPSDTTVRITVTAGSNRRITSLRFEKLGPDALVDDGGLPLPGSNWVDSQSVLPPSPEQLTQLKDFTSAVVKNTKKEIPVDVILPEKHTDDQGPASSNGVK